MPYVSIAAIDAVVGGAEVSVPAAYVEIIDKATGYNGPGSYHIQLQVGSILGPIYRMTYGLPPADGPTLMTIGRVVLTPTGAIIVHGAPKLNIGMTGVNATIMQTANVDGSYLANGVVTGRTILGGVSGLLDTLGATQGDILYRSAAGWVVLGPGTPGYVLSTGGAGANPLWIPASSGGGASGYGSSFPGSPSDKELFFRTDLDALFMYLSSSPGPGWFNTDSLAQLNDVALTSLADDDLLSYDSGTSKWINASLSTLFDDVLGNTRGSVIERGASAWGLIAPGAANTIFASGGSGADPSWQTLSALIDAAIGNTRGAVLYRGASGWAILAPGTSGDVLTSQGSGADPDWAVAGTSGVSSLNSLTGALSLISSDSSISITPSGATIDLKAVGGGGGGTTAAPVPIQSSECVRNSPGTGTIADWLVAPTSGNFLVFVGSCNGSPTTPTGWTLAHSQGQIFVYTRTANGTSADNLTAGAAPGSNWVGMLMEFGSGVSITGFAGNTNTYWQGSYANTIVTPSFTAASTKYQLAIAVCYSNSGQSPYMLVAVPWVIMNSKDVATEPGAVMWAVVSPSGTVRGSAVYTANGLNTSYGAILGLTN